MKPTSTHNGMTDRIRALLRANGPMTVAEITEQLGAGAIRDNVAALLSQRRKAGEFTATVMDGKPTYSLVVTFKSSCPQRKSKASQQPFSPPAPSSAQDSAPTGPASVVSESPAPPRTPVATPPHAAHAATPETPPKRGPRAKPAGELAEKIERAAVRAARSEPTQTHAIAALLRSVADLIDPPATGGAA